ncbi:polysaccharide biosynthesis tyrosine autokinase [Paraflavisolibacter sp. H34]|uniref:GumC family protein n=1 Tax=Huijunlia imazamoxiresistens TaxID=3127457 RepID=UPI00301B4E68
MDVKNTKKGVETKEQNFISVLMFRFMPYWPLFLVLFVIGIAGAWAYLQYATPLYETYATILVKDEKKGVDESNVLEALEIPAAKKIVENEIEVIRSRKLVREVVSELHLYAPIFEKGKLKVTSAYASSPVTIQAREPERIKGKEPQDIFFRVKGDAVVIGDTAYPMNQWVTTPYGVLRFSPNLKKSKDPLHPMFFRLLNPKDVAAGLLGNLDVRAANKLATVVTIVLKDEVPKRGEDIVNLLIANYNQMSVDDKNRLAANTLEFVEKRLGTVQQELDSLENQIQHYRAKNNVVNLSEQGRLYLQNVGINDRKVADLNMQLAVLDQVERYVRSKDSSAAIVPSALGIEDPALSELTQKLYNSKLEYEKVIKTTGENNPMAITLAREIEAMQPHIMEKLQNQRSNLQAGRNNLAANSSTFNALLRSIPEKERELAEISRQQASKSTLYNFLLEKREQSELAISSSVADTKTIDAAETSALPVSPKKVFIYMGALVVALGLGVGLISAKELMNKNILFRSEIESMTAVPVVGEISYNAKKETLANANSRLSLVAEQFRQLRAAIGLYGKDAGYKKLLVTSSIPGEGKTYISVNLAMSLALAGKKVVLLDLDIRNPKASALFGVSGQEGVAEFLAGTSRPEDITRPTGYFNLFVIGAGRELVNAREAMLNGQLEDLLTLLGSAFDYIVVDSSPVGPVSDAYVLSEWCDTTLFVVRHGYTPKTIVQLMDNNSKVKPLKNPQIIFNDVRSRGIFKGAYGYGYGYGYEYVYKAAGKEEVRKLLEN